MAPPASERRYGEAMARTRRTLRLHSPPIERPPVVQKRAWLPRLRKRQGTTATTSSGSDTEPPSFNAAQLAAAGPKPTAAVAAAAAAISANRTIRLAIASLCCRNRRHVRSRTL